MKKTLVLIASLTVVLLFGYTTSSLAACLEEHGDVLTCKNSCSNCDSLKTACQNGGADYEKTPSGGKCTVGAKGKVAGIKRMSVAPAAPTQTLVKPNTQLRTAPKQMAK